MNITFDTPDRLSQLQEDAPEYQDTISVPVSNRPRQKDAVSEILQEQEEAQALESEMTEVELRLEEANWYKVLLTSPLFAQDNPIAAKVEAEVRAFVKSKLRILLGIEQEKKPESTFSDTEVTALKGLAARIIGGQPKAPQAPAMAPRPELKPADATPLVQGAPKLAPRPEPRPQFRKEEPKKEVKKKAKKTFLQTMPDGKEKEIEVDLTPPTGYTAPNSISKLQQIADMAMSKAQNDALQSGSNSLVNQLLAGVQG